MNIAFLFEHPDWSVKLLDCFTDRQISVTPFNIADLAFETSQDHNRWAGSFDLVVNRVNIMPSAGHDPSIVFHTLHFLTWLEIQNVPVINGARAHFAGASKAVQNGMFSKLGLEYPSAIAIHDSSQALAAAQSIGYPLIIKPNIGGSGSGIEKFDNKAALTQAVMENRLDLGVDGTGLVQEYIESDGYIYRVEMLGDQLFYAIRQQKIDDRFNYCAIDGCNSDESMADTGSDFANCSVESTSGVEVYRPAANIVEKVKAINQLAGADVGGVEYLLNSRTGQPCFYDFNPYSNFIADGEALLGFSPDNHYIDFVLERAAESRTANQS